jgi:TonB-linked SusC/RagA family outer membrane protein
MRATKTIFLLLLCSVFCLPGYAAREAPAGLRRGDPAGILRESAAGILHGDGHKLTGTVRDEKGLPLTGVTVLVKSDAKGTATQTDGNGHFVVDAESGAILQFSYVGYETRQLIGTSKVMNITLTLSTTSLNDVVIIGYGSEQKKDLTGAISTVSEKDFQGGAITTPEQLIAGKVAGVSITSNGGSPGSGSTIRIRGAASLNASNDPLIVIDGLPLSGDNIYGTSDPLSLVNPNDIETFTVLKDAAATAIYGSRASNGVIIITTKKGKRGKPAFNFTTQVSESKLTKEVPVLSAAEVRQYVDSLGTSAEQSLLGSANTDWQKVIYQTAVSTDNNLSVTGSLKNLPYRLSAGYLDQNGLLRTDNLQRTTVGLSLSPRLFHDDLKIDINIKGAESKARFANNGAIGAAVSFDPTQPVHAPNAFGNYFEWTTTANGVTTLNPNGTRNPLALLNLYNNTATVDRSYGNAQFDYKFPFLPDLHANLNLGYDLSNSDGNTYVPAYAAQDLPTAGEDDPYANRTDNTVVEFYFSYLKKFKKLKSTLNATAGYGYYNDLSKDFNYYNFNAAGDTISGSQPTLPFTKPENTLVSYYGRAIYTYNNKYILSASIREDGSSKFAPDVRWGVFPSVGFTWRINNEAFLQKATALSDLKLRLSYGVTGNQDGIADYSYEPIYGYSINSALYQFGNSYYNMLTPAAFDANIKWEQTATANIGLDYGFFNNRLSGSVDAYDKKTSNLLNTIPVPAGTNFANTLLENVGNIENKGVEFTISATPIRTKNFTWDVSFNIAFNSNKITNLTATKDSTFQGDLTGTGVGGSYVQINTVGYAANSFYVYHQVYGKNGAPAEGVYADLNHDGVINQDDLYHDHSPFPAEVLGFSTQFTYKRWSLSTVLRANIGNYMYNAVAANSGVETNVLNSNGFINNSSTDIYKTHFYTNQFQSDYYIQNASFVKMDNLGLAYNLGSVFSVKSNLRLNLNVQNVFTITKYTGINPEIYGGVDNTLYPVPRIYTLGANLVF